MLLIHRWHTCHISYCFPPGVKGLCYAFSFLFQYIGGNIADMAFRYSFILLSLIFKSLILSSLRSRWNKIWLNIDVVASLHKGLLTLAVAFTLHSLYFSLWHRGFCDAAESDDERNMEVMILFIFLTRHSENFAHCNEIGTIWMKLTIEDVFLIQQ